MRATNPRSYATKAFDTKADECRLISRPTCFIHVLTRVCGADAERDAHDGESSAPGNKLYPEGVELDAGRNADRQLDPARSRFGFDDKLLPQSIARVKQHLKISPESPLLPGSGHDCSYRTVNRAGLTSKLNQVQAKMPRTTRAETLFRQRWAVAQNGRWRQLCPHFARSHGRTAYSLA